MADRSLQSDLRNEAAMNNGDFQHALDSLMSFDDAVSLGADCIEHHALSSWALGDLAARVAELRPGDPLVAEKAETLRKFAAAIKQRYSRVKELAAISHAVPPEIRSPALSHSHYRVIVKAGCTHDQLIAWAARAEDAGWNAEGLAREIKKSKTTARNTLDRHAKDALDFLARGSSLAHDVTDSGALRVALAHPEEIDRALVLIRAAITRFERAKERAKSRKCARGTHATA